MKSKIILILGIIFLSLTSCKENKKDEVTDEVKVDAKQNFSLDLDVICLKKDDFTLFYTEDKSISFTADKTAWRGVIASPLSQRVTMDLKGEIIPTNIRLDFGVNKDQEDIILEKFKISYYGKTFEAKGSEFFKYFIPNTFIKTEIDQVKGTVKFLKSASFSTPFFYPHQAIIDELIKITK